MSVVSVQPKDFILALFIRDDGERFLLGDNGYDFTDSQLHFAANTIENDEVEKQGADGTMLAGQVRRASVQTFDGYVGDATTPKEEIEQMRRAFIAFFLKDHHYRVIYVDCARNAWQRKGGYLVDAPEVKELFQVHPEYHVGLNFEDVNYYSYDENAEGDEITANLVQVAISSAVEGGLVWDEDGAVSEDAVVEYDTESATASGANISINDAVMAPIVGFGIKGNTVQSGTPTPSSPIPVQTVTGENVVKISDGQGNEQSYEVNLGKNLIDTSSLVVGNIDASGADSASNQVVRSGYINVAPGVYTLKVNNSDNSINLWRYALYDSGKTFISATTPQAKSATITVSEIGYIRVSFYNIPWKELTVQEIIDSQVQLEAGQATSYAAYFEPIELCKIGDYQDYIWKDGDTWKVHKATGKVVFDGSESGWEKTTAYTGYFRGMIKIGEKPADYAGFCDHFTVRTGGHGGYNYVWNFLGDNSKYVQIEQTIIGGDTLALFQTWLSQNNVNWYYALATPTDTEITNAALIAQLEAILSQGYTYAGTNNITTVIAAGNEQGELEIEYYTRYEFEITAGGYEWEQGGSGGPTIVMNESIDNVYPIWTITGPITNPVLENTTTGEQIEYVGTIGEGQTLIIDMGEQTALLDGLNVLSNVAGEFISLAPGANTLLYSVSNGDTASEIGWSEIVG